MRGLAEFIIGGRINAIFIAGFFGALSVVSWYLVPLSIFSASALTLVLLRLGERKALDIAFYAGLLIFLVFILLPVKAEFPLPLVFIVWVVVIAGGEALARTSSQANALMVIGLVCTLLMVGMNLSVNDANEFWAQWLPQIGETGDRDLADPGEISLNRLLNGLMAMYLGFASMFSLMFARWMQAVLFNPGGFVEEFISIRLPRLLLLGVVTILSVLGSFSMQMMNELFMIVMMVYFFCGLAVLQGIVIRRRAHKVWALIPYLGVFLAPQIFIPGCAMLGAVDTFANFRSLR